MTGREKVTGRPGGMRLNLGMKAHDPKPEFPIADVVRWLNQIRDDPWYERNPVPWSAPAFCELVGLSSRTIKDAALGKGIRGNVTPYNAAAIGKVMKLIEAGQLVFVRDRGGRQGAHPWEPRYIDPPEVMPPPQQPLLRRADYLWWSRCRSCNGRKYAGVRFQNDEYAACWGCIPANRYNTIAAVPSTRHLLEDILKK